MHWRQACFVAAAVAGVGVTLTAVAPGQNAYAQMQESIAAIVNEDVITTYDVRQRARLLIASAGLEATRESQQRAQAQALRDLVDERLQMQEAGRFDIEISDAQIDDEIASLARQSGVTPEALSQQLEAAGIRPTTLRDQVRADLSWRRLINGLYGSRVRISPVEVQATEARITASAARAQYQVSEIFIPAETDNELAEARGAAQRLLEELQRGAPFPQVARQFSAAPSAMVGGDLGWLTAGELAPEIQTVVDQLQPGQVSLPITTRRGVYLVALRERREGVDPGALSQVSVLQVVAPASSRSQLERVRGRVTGCAGLASLAEDVTGVDIVDLGFSTEGNLDAAVRPHIVGLNAGQASSIYEAPGGVAMAVVCTRASAAGLPDRDQIEDRLFEEELTMLAQRHLRDLRREASITAP
jgi:peptidyl-prolyl cis-trans isomerase SurA